jgi:hypothetical protein
MLLYGRCVMATAIDWSRLAPIVGGDLWVWWFVTTVFGLSSEALKKHQDKGEVQDAEG